MKEAIKIEEKLYKLRQEKLDKLNSNTIFNKLVAVHITEKISHDHNPNPL